MVDVSENVAETVIKEKPESNETSGDIGGLSEQLAAVGLPRNPPRELPRLLPEAAEIRQEFAALQQPFSALNNREKKIPEVPWLALCALIIIFIVGGALSWWQNFYFLWVSLASGICSSLLIGWGGWRTIERKKASAECREERSRLEQKKMLAQKRQAELSDRCEALGLPSSAIDLVRVQKLVAAHHDLLEKYWKQDGFSATDKAVFPDERSHDCEKATAETNESAVTDEAGQELLQLEARMAEFETGLKEKELRLRELELQLKDLSTDQGPHTTTPGTTLHHRKRELEERLAVLRKAINLLAEAVDEFGRSHLTTLNDEASKLLSKITGGRYSAIKLDENMAPAVQIDGRRWRPVESFSRGTVDAIYLALRIALAKVRDDGRSLPLMLDDPFVHLDQKRLTTTLNLIDLASADGQLILFSHNLDLGKRAARERWHVIPLDGDSVSTSTEEGDEHVGQLHLL